jgi:hypothetical protein
MRAQITLGNVSEFSQHEPAMLAVINGAANGPELFLADPFRFLGEHGYVVSAALQAQMESAAPALAKTPKQLYNGIAAGRASLTGHSTLNITWHIRSLGVKL